MAAMFEVSMPYCDWNCRLLMRGDSLRLFVEIDRFRHRCVPFFVGESVYRGAGVDEDTLNSQTL